MSSGGGQSSLNYLFGSAEPPKPSAPAANNAPAVPDAVKDVPSAKPASNPHPAVPAGANSSRPTTNNYFRADGQNTGNFLTDRPSTKVHAAPGGGSSLGYLFGGGSN